MGEEPACWSRRGSEQLAAADRGGPALPHANRDAAALVLPYWRSGMMLMGYSFSLLTRWPWPEVDGRAASVNVFWDLVTARADCDLVAARVCRGLVAAWWRPDPALVAVFYPAAAERGPPPAAVDSERWLTVPVAPPLPPDGCIFLLETSGRRHITPREWCTVESAASAHPSMLVVLLAAAPRLRRSALTDRLLERNNIILARLDFGSLFADTLFERWYQSRAVLRSPWPAVHMSDAVRVAVLLHHGGIYLDTDVIVRRSLAALDDGAGLESERAVASGVLKFSRDSAVPRLLASCLTEGYDPYNWGHNGPGVVTKVLIEGCGLRDPPLTITHCGNYTIYGRQCFYAIPWENWSLFLELDARDAVLERVNARTCLAEQYCPWSLQQGGADF
ncbi:lactosylceramide 4-alpha-galactosyltransferase-like [Pollicipes pollicipes]|uniref:lactosylceramide 4-alpha-galactosyltransferase-like n=1 Tax=Pollicipes pollicipes TaxID=41117 RepID=UPI001884E186|nr:lactosylceramide 4-alpha-galactosyltransferase-like [Pollicipes pollicipes]